MASFMDIYNRIYENSAHELEKMRKESRNRNIIIVSVGVFIFVSLGIILKQVAIPFILSFIMIILLEIIFIKVNIRYKLTYKKLVIQEFLKAYNENLNYYPTRRMESSTYCDAEFERFDKYHSEDYIQGNIDGMDIRLAEIRTKVETQDKEGNKSYSTVFHGLFATIQNQNSIKEKIYIRTDKGIFGNLLKKNRMELDSSEFEKYFDIYGENKIIIMQLLTSDIMEAMIEFKEKNNIKYEITIKNNNIYIRFHCGSMFEPKLFGNALDVDLLTKTYKIMNFVFDISKLITKTLKEIDV